MQIPTPATVALLDYLKQNDKALVFMIMSAGAVAARHTDRKISNDALELAEVSLALFRVSQHDALKNLITLFGSTVAALTNEEIG